ncbi:MAG: hypothetical protein SH850_17030 [Planctomycetaceae bacterium]|nr:hypothetical protein [Planctomycetaceae bacterium]
MERADELRREDLDSLLLKSANRDSRKLLEQRKALRTSKPGTRLHRIAEVAIIGLEDRLQGVRPIIERRRATHAK